MEEDKREKERKLVRMYRVLYDMMEWRGYNATVQKRNIPDEEIVERYKAGDQVETFHHLTDPGRNCDVFLNYSRQQVKKDFLKRLLATQDEEVRHTIVVIYEGKKQNLNRYCIDLAEQYRLSEGKSIEFLEEHHLMFNIMRHELVPEHLLITDHEKAELLNKYKIKESQLPKILVSDPVSIFLGLRRGDVVKIVRKSETAGTYISYRAVV